jgi:predicted MFS family arabinose efflux permease
VTDPGARHSARVGLLVLTGINLFNYIDRYVLPVLGETLRTSSLHISDTQFGFLSSGFIIVYMLTAPFFGALGDTRSRTRLIALGIFIWSAATALGGLAWGFVSLFIARALVGVGEAAYGSISPSLLADYYPSTHRGRVFGVFYAVIPIGAALGYFLGGQMDVHFGWRSAFFVAGVPGFVLAAMALQLRDPPRGVHDDPAAHASRPAGGALNAYVSLLRNRRYMVTVLGYAAYTFALGAMVVFMPKFLMRVRGLPESVVSLKFSLVLLVTGLGGSLMGGWLGDRLQRWTRQSYLWLSGIATLIAAPLALLALRSPDPSTYWAATTAAAALLFLSTGPINTMIVGVVPPTMRATAMAASIFAIHILGDVPSPTILGMMSDRSSLAQAVLIIPVAILIGGIIWTVGALKSSS